jgi:hypothetical protein
MLIYWVDEIDLRFWIKDLRIWIQNKKFYKLKRETKK